MRRSRASRATVRRSMDSPFRASAWHRAGSMPAVVTWAREVFDDVPFDRARHDHGPAPRVGAGIRSRELVDATPVYRCLPGAFAAARRRALPQSDSRRPPAATRVDPLL